MSGGAFVPNGLWPGFDGAYLFGDCVCGGMFKLTQSGSALAASDFACGLGTLVHMQFGPHGATQALYYTTYAGGGQVHRIARDDPYDFFSLTPCRLPDTRNPTARAAARRCRTASPGTSRRRASAVCRRPPRRWRSTRP